MKYQSVTVHPGDFETRFLPEPGVGRDIDPGRCKALHKDWQPHVGYLVLRTGPSPDSYYVLDGQHRLTVASEREEPTKFHALLYESADLRRASIPDLVIGLNRGRHFRAGDFLKAKQEGSRWPGIFSRKRLDPNFGSSTNRLTWAGIVRGRCIADRAMVREHFNGGNSVDVGELLAAWLTEERTYIEEMAEFCSWWESIATVASERGVNTLFSAVGLAIGFLCWKENPSEGARTSIYDKIALYPAIGNFRSARTGNDLAHEFMAAVNYKRRVPLRVLGFDGRNE